jgi:hypothetical protein
MALISRQWHDSGLENFLFPGFCVGKLRPPWGVSMTKVKTKQNANRKKEQFGFSVFSILVFLVLNQSDLANLLLFLGTG